MKSSMKTRPALIGLMASVVVAVVATAGLSLATPHTGKGKGSGATTHPPGNNGTVKVDGQPFDTGPNNEPHPGCDFRITFFGYDQGDLNATYAFSLQPPSGRGNLTSGNVFIGEDPAGGGRDFDGSTGSVDLSTEFGGATANRNQGYHVFLTVHAEGSIGSDVKHKVFWVQCAEKAPTGGPRAPKHTRSGAAAASGGASRSAPARAGRVQAARAARPVKGSPAFTG